MEETVEKIVDPNQKVEDLDAFFTKATAKKVALNKKVRDTIAKLKNDLKKQIPADNRIILFSVASIEETLVLFSEKVVHMFSGISASYPKTGLFLRRIDIIYEEYVSDSGLEYHDSVVVLFVFNKDVFNVELSLFPLEFSDPGGREFQIKKSGDVSKGDHEVFLSFADEEKYLPVLNFIHESRRALKRTDWTR